MSLKKDTIAIATVVAAGSMFMMQNNSNTRVFAADDSEEAYYPKPSQAQDMPTDPSQDQNSSSVANNAQSTTERSHTEKPVQSHTQSRDYTILTPKKNYSSTSNQPAYNKQPQAAPKQVKENSLSVKPKAQTSRKEIVAKKNASKNVTKSHKSRAKKVVKHQKSQKTKPSLFKLKDAIVGSVSVVIAGIAAVIYKNVKH